MRKVPTFLLLFILFIPSIIFAEKPILTIETDGHSALIRDIMFTSDGRYLISSSEDKTIRVWDVKTGEITRIIRGQIGAGREGKIFAAALSPDDNWLAVGGLFPGTRYEGHSIRLIDFRRGEIKSLLKGHSNSINDLAFSTDGRYLVSGSSDKSARIWDISSQKSLQVLKGHKNLVHKAVFSPDARLVATGSFDSTIRLWDARDGSLIKILRGHDDRVKSIAFTPDGKYLLSGSDDKTIRLWDVRTGRLIRVMASQDDRVESLSISPDGTKGVTGFGGYGTKTNNVFSIPSGDRMASFKEHKNLVAATTISPDGKVVATGGGSDHEICIWDLNTAQVINKMVGRGKTVWSVAFSEDGRSIAWGKTKKRSSVSGYRPLEQSFRIRSEGRGYDLQMGHEIATDTAYVRELKSRGQYSVRTKTVKKHSILQILKNKRVTHKVKWDTSGLYRYRSITLIPDGRSAIGGGSVGLLASYDTNTGKKIHDFIGHFGDVFSVACSPDGRFLVSGSSDQTVRLWEIDSGKLLLTIFHASDNEWVAWIPEGFYTSSVNGDNYVGWHVNRGESKSADYYYAKQFSRYLNRPDIVNNTLKFASSKEAIKAAKMEHITVSALVEHAPVDILIANANQIDSNLTEFQVQLKKNNVNLPERITIFVNGAQILTQDERKLVNIKPGSLLAYKILTRNRTNLVRIQVENKWAETYDETIIKNKQWMPPSKPQGNLYITAIGICRYPNLSQNQQLYSPKTDCVNIIERFKKLEGILYKEVIDNTITDNDGSLVKTNMVIETLSEQANKTKPIDTSIIFLAGHGMTDLKEDYHFVTADTKIKDIEKNFSIENSFSWKALHKIIDQILGKRIVIVDTCQAGGVFRSTTPNINKFVKDIHDVNAVIFTGTSRQQYAAEDKKGGAFTQCIIDGIDNKTIYKNSSLFITDLANYIKKKVPIMNLAIAKRGIKITQKKKTKDKRVEEMNLPSTQEPVVIVPKGMKQFEIYKEINL